MPSISLCMIVKNEEHNLPHSLAPIAGVFDEVIAVDTGSGDKTRSMARDYGASVYEQEWRNDFSRARNFSIEMASCDWIMWLDADNRMNIEDAEKISGLIQNRRDTIFWCTEVVEPGGSELIQKRIFPNRPEYRFEGPVHEQLVHPENGVRYIMTDIKIYHWGYVNKDLLREKGTRNMHILEEQLRRNPEDWYYNFHIARCYGNFREFDNAVFHLNKVTGSERAEKENPDIYFYSFIMLFLFHEKMKRINEARGALDSLLRKNPEYGLGWFYSGRLNFSEGNLQEAARKFRMFHGLGFSSYSVDIPRKKIFFESYYWLAQCYERFGEAAPALDAYRKSLDYEPENSHVHLKLGLLLQGLGKEEEGRQYFKECLRLHPENTRARAALGLN